MKLESIEFWLSAKYVSRTLMKGQDLFRPVEWGGHGSCGLLIPNRSLYRHRPGNSGIQVACSRRPRMTQYLKRNAWYVLLGNNLHDSFQENLSSVRWFIPSNTLRCFKLTIWQVPPPSLVCLRQVHILTNISVLWFVLKKRHLYCNWWRENLHVYMQSLKKKLSRKIGLTNITNRALFFGVHCQALE